MVITYLLPCIVLICAIDVDSSTSRKKATEVIKELGERWKLMSEEEKSAATDNSLTELKENREM